MARELLVIGGGGGPRSLRSSQGPPALKDPSRRGVPRSLPSADFNKKQQHQQQHQQRFKSCSSPMHAPFLLLLLLLLLQLSSACCSMLRHGQQPKASPAFQLPPFRRPNSSSSSSSAARSDVGVVASQADSALANDPAAAAAAAAAKSDLPVPVVLLLGPPCSGKGTLCQELQHLLPVAHVSSGDELRRLTKAAAAAADPAADSAAAAAAEEGAGAFPKDVVEAVGQRMRQGLLVDDELMVRVLQHRLRAAAAEPLPSQQQRTPQLLLLDGFPRNAQQVSLLHAMGAWPVAVLLLSASTSCLLKRVSQRIIDPQTGVVYGPLKPPPPALLEALKGAPQGAPQGVSGIDAQGHTQGLHGKREDDSPEVLIRRIQTYNETLPGILQALKAGGAPPGERASEGGPRGPPPVIIEVDASRHIKEVIKDAFEALKDLPSMKGAPVDEGPFRGPQRGPSSE
ncbi:hypothetical protein Emag_003487 [Eimeria magna]